MSISKPFAYNNTSFSTLSGFDGSVDSVSVQSDGKLLVGGNFSTYQNLSQNKLIRLNSNATKDDTFNIGSGFNSIVTSVIARPDGKILVGGYFTEFSSSAQNSLIRLNSDGSKDSSFNIGSGFDAGVDSMAVQSDGKILVGGGFSNYNGVSQNRLIRLNSDGSKDNTFNIGSGFDNEVKVIKLNSDGSIFAAGFFTSYNNVTENRLVKLNSDGSVISLPITVSGTTQYGDLVVGNIQTDYSSNYGGFTWWGGPDEELGYVIGGVVHGGQPVPVGVGGTAYVGFWRSDLLTSESFLSLANFIGSENAQPPFTSTTDAVTWLNNNGYYTSYS